ncbi:hypothetical protein OIDMADRAFT_31117 [Oidiodendron maius Zn]|uniref:Uncharacterized protein n=1 Tax=Oidiodendron maius (strain Zn) TaxID=913774 RepID=A0A0C3D8P8_OIDMZ|nr:hypothetical protein OIDMADRAFT_31117 [Oidiodendron maius Zn]
MDRMNCQVCLDKDIYYGCYSVDHGILGPARGEEGGRGYPGSSSHYLEEIEFSNIGDPPSYSTVIWGSLLADFSPSLSPCEAEAEVPLRPSVSEQLAERRHVATGDQPAKKVTPAALMEEW